MENENEKLLSKTSGESWLTDDHNSEDGDNNGVDSFPSDDAEWRTDTSRHYDTSPSCNVRRLSGRNGDDDRNAESQSAEGNDITASDKGAYCCCRNRKCPPPRVVVTCVACFIVQFTLGVTYTTGNMLPYLTSYFHMKTDTSVGYAQTMWISASHSISVSAAMPFLGLLENRLPPWGFRLLGIVLFCGSYFGASWAIQTSFFATVAFLGIIQGCGQAILYPACLNLPLQWLPKRRGLLGGLIMAGFGGGAFLWDQVITSWINPHNLQPDLHVKEDLYFNQTIVLERVPTCYLLLGGVLSTVQILCLLCMIYPSRLRGNDVKINKNINNVTSVSSSSPTNENVCNVAEDKCNDATEDARLPRPSSSSSSSSSTSRQITSDRVCTEDMIRDYSPLELLRSRTMWTITIFSFFVDLSIDIVLDFYKSYGQTFVHNDRLLSIMASFGSVINAVSRPVWGFFADRVGFQACLIVSQALLAFGSAMFVVCEVAGAAMLFLVVCLVFLAAGGIYGEVYTLIFLLFGAKNFTFNLGCLGFTGVFSSLIDIYVVKTLKNAFGWHGIFLAASVFAFIGLLINWSLTCDCGHPLPAQMKGPLFHPRRSLVTSADASTDTRGDPQWEARSTHVQRD